jgi:hypothetical protein
MSTSNKIFHESALGIMAAEAISYETVNTIVNIACGIMQLECRGTDLSYILLINCHGIVALTTTQSQTESVHNLALP